MEWLTVPEYMKKFGISRKAIESMAESGYLIVAAVGNRKYVKLQSNAASDGIKEVEQKIDALCKHLGVQI